MDFESRFIPFWNQKILEPPAILSLKLKTKNAVQTSGRLAKDLTNILAVLENLDFLHFDAALVSRLLFRTRKSLRNDKGYKGFQKVYRILRNYLELNLLQVVSENRNASYDDKGPSKEMLEWCLISMKRFATLFCRLEKTCTETAYYLHNHITTGNRWHLALLFLACLSRVWTVSRYLLLHVCEWYSQLKTYLECLESKGRWLPLGYSLPDDLCSWLKNPDFLCELNRKKLLVEEKMLPKATEKSSIFEGLLFNEDFGEIVSRDDGLLITPEREKNKIKKPEDIEKFLRDEESHRRNKTKSLTSIMSDTEWKYLRNYLKKCLKEITTAKNRKIYNESMNRACKKMKSWLGAEI